MAYGDKLFEDGVEHIENGAGNAFCGYPDKGFYTERKPGLVVCESCRLMYERETTMIDRWNGGQGLEGGKRTPGLGAFKGPDELTGVTFGRKKR